MSRVWVTVIGMSAALAALGPAAEKPKAAAAPAAPAANPHRGVQDVIFLGDARPLRLRLVVTLDGKPFRDAWQDFMKRLFEFLDADHDGVLSKKEAERIPSAQFLQFQARGIFAITNSYDTQLTAEKVDANQDGKVTFEEMTAYYERAGFGPLQLGIGPDHGLADKLTALLYEQLDQDHDGKLTQAEAAAAPTALSRFDLNDDEILTPEEVDPSLGSLSIFNQQRNATRESDAAGLAKTGFLVVSPTDPPVRTAQALIRRYDKDKDQRLSRAEIGFDRELFDSLDANRDGRLTAEELAKWLAGPPDLELRSRVGSPVAYEKRDNLVTGIAAVIGAGNEDGVEIVPVAAKKTIPADAIRKDGKEGSILDLGGARLDVRRNVANTLNNFGLKTIYLQDFRSAAGKKGYATKAEADKTMYVGKFFTLADRDGDGKLTDAEFNAFLDVQGRAGGCFVSVIFSDWGRNLFDLLDGNHDGRLTPRELLSAWAKLAPYDKAKKGSLRLEDLPRNFQVVIGQGEVLFVGRFGRVPLGAPAAESKGLFGGAAGPLWFRRMDRNGDGDVSPREFLGSPEDFRRVDANGDGLIDPAEANKADEWFRKKAAGSRR